MRILQLIPYPTTPKTHGGQIRVGEIKKFLEGRGAEVVQLRVAPPGYPSYDQVELALSAEELEEFVEGPLTYDLGITLYLKAHREVVERLVQSVPRPNFIFLEQPWLWPVAERLLELYPTAKLVYSSQNVEYLTKLSLYTGEGVGNLPEYRATLQQILELESNLVRRADWTIAVTPQDLFQFRRWGVKRGVLAPNGTTPREVDWEVLEETRRKLEGFKFLLFVGSNYPPNVRGFWKMVGNLSYLSPTEVIVAAGRIGEILIEFAPPELELWESYLKGRLVTPGFISDEELTALYLLSNGVLIPILHGGGSNLKTAEALYFNRPVISTKFGLRGVPWGELVGTPVEVAETPEQFQRKLRQLLEAPPPNPTPENLQFNPQFLWENTLQPISEILEN